MKTEVTKALSAEELKNVNGGGYMGPTGTDMEGNVYTIGPDGMVWRVTGGGTVPAGDFTLPFITWNGGII